MIITPNSQWKKKWYCSDITLGGPQSLFKTGIATHVETTWENEA